MDPLVDRRNINLREGPAFMEGLHALIDHLRSLGLPSEPSGRPVLPLVFHKRIELDTFILERILDRWIGHGLAWGDIAPKMMHLLKSEAHNTLQRRLRTRISTHWSRPDATAEGLDVLRTLDGDVVRKERDLLERSALVLREFGYGFGISNSHVIEVLRWYTRAAMHYLMITLEAADISEPQTNSEFYHACSRCPRFGPSRQRRRGGKLPIRCRCACTTGTARAGTTRREESSCQRQR